MDTRRLHTAAQHAAEGKTKLPTTPPQHRYGTPTIIRSRSDRWPLDCSQHVSASKQVGTRSGIEIRYSYKVQEGSAPQGRVNYSDRVAPI
jgi:hypothetical protein